MQTDALFEHWARAFEATQASGDLKAAPEDFRVIEQANYAEDSDEQAAGEHLYLLLQKRNQTTRELVRSVADANAIPISSIGYAGMKDKHAVTQQWVSVPIGNEGTGSADVAVPEEAEELGRVRQSKKLRRGWHNGNHFEIVLRDVKGATAEQLDTRLQQISQHGVPNYFGQQRFGTDNLEQAIAWLPRRRRERNAFKRGLHLSVLRSFLFNEVLSSRIADGTWNSPLEGEAAPEGPLWGRGRVQASEAVIALERAALEEHMSIAGELEFAGLNQERRALVLQPQNLSWSQPDSKTLRLEFGLLPGCYATSVLRELGQFTHHRQTPAQTSAPADRPQPPAVERLT